MITEKLSMEYLTSLYESKSLKEYATEYLKHLPENVRTLLSQGSSGSAIASAMLIISDRKLSHISIRKEKENSHHPSYAGPSSSLTHSEGYCIVDDFIERGNTIRRIVEWAKDRCINIDCAIVAFNREKSLLDQVEFTIITIDEEQEEEE